MTSRSCNRCQLSLAFPRRTRSRSDLLVTTVACGHTHHTMPAANGHHTDSVTASSTLTTAQDSSTSSAPQSTVRALPLVTSRLVNAAPCRPDDGVSPADLRCYRGGGASSGVTPIVTFVDPREVEDQYPSLALVLAYGPGMPRSDVRGYLQPSTSTELTETRRQLRRALPRLQHHLGRVADRRPSRTPGDPRRTGRGSGPRWEVLSHRLRVSRKGSKA